MSHCRPAGRESGPERRGRGSNGLALRAAAAGLLLAAPAVGQSVADITGSGHERGSAAAPVEVVEFADFACFSCGQFARETMHLLEEEFVATGRVRWRYIPFSIGFPKGKEAAWAAECAAEQGAFWAMHDRLYADQREWIRQRNPRATFVRYAAELELDATRFLECYGSGRVRDRIRRNSAAAERLQVRGTPTFFINGEIAVGALPGEQFRELIARAEKLP